MILNRSFLVQIPFIQNINTYIFADKISPDLAMELPRPSPLNFQAQDFSSCVLFLCLVSWEGSQVTGWYLPLRFWFTLPFILAHNIDWNKAPRTCLGNCGNRCKFTPNLSALTAVTPMHEQSWGFSADKGVPAFKAKANSKFPQGRHFPLQEALQDPREQGILWVLELFQAPDSLQLPTINILKQLSALSAPRTFGTTNTL